MSLSKLDYAANKSANGTYPGNAKYIFSAEDWEEFKKSVSGIVNDIIGKSPDDLKFGTPEFIENGLRIEQLIRKMEAGL